MENNKSTILYDTMGREFMTTEVFENGFVRIRRNGTEIKYENLPKNLQALVDENVNSVMEEREAKKINPYVFENTTATGAQYHDVEEYKEKKWLSVIRRILMIPPFLIIALIGGIIRFIIQAYNIIVYGGEVIGYNKITNRKTIFGTYQKINSLIEKYEKA
jgi:hypothetical protein